MRALAAGWKALRIYERDRRRVIAIEEAWLGLRVGPWGCVWHIIPTALKLLAHPRISLIERVDAGHTKLTFRTDVLIQE